MRAADSWRRESCERRKSRAATGRRRRRREQRRSFLCERRRRRRIQSAMREQLRKGAVDYMNLEPAEMRTLQFGPFWMLSAVAGTYNRFKSYELAVFWDTVVAVALRTPFPARDILTSLAEDRSGLLLDFELDDRPVVSGLRQIMEILDRIEPETSSDFRFALIRIGADIARNRGPYGRTIMPEQEQLLLLMAELLEIDSETDLGDVLV
jgi:hypothetical protein